jgi:hypothetical protein
MPTIPTALTARLGSTNLPVAKTLARIVWLASTKPRRGCRIVCHAFLALMNIKLDQKSAQRVVLDNTRIWRAMQRVWIVLPVSTWKVWVLSIVWIVILACLKVAPVQKLVKRVVQDNIKILLEMHRVSNVKLASTWMNKVRSIVNHAFLERTRTDWGRQNAKHAVLDNIKTSRAMLRV